MLEVIMIVFAVVFIVDYSGAIDNLSKLIFSFFNKSKYNGWRIPLIGCSLCSTFWVMILYFSLIGLTLPYIIGGAALCAYSTSIILELMYKIREWIVRLLSII